METLLLGFSVAFTPINLAYCFAGVFLGTFIGVLPGVGASAAVALLLPFSYYIEPTTALVFLGGIYYGAEYGGSTAAILLNLPGTSSNVVTCIDGYPMARQGRAGVALFVTTIASFVGGSIGILLMIFLTPLLVDVALSFGAAEYFSAMLFGLVASATIARGSPLKGVAMVVAGLILGTVGMDPNSGVHRYTFGLLELYDGFTVAIIAMGLFGVAEVIASINTAESRKTVQKVSLRSMLPTRDDVRRSIAPVFRGTAIGSLFGVLPGTGPTISAFMGYAVEKRVSREPERFGTGAVEGIASPESANNAAAQTSFIPTLALGIPGSATMAIMLGALMIHGIAPGPRLVEDQPDLFWGLVASFWIGNVLLLVLNIPMIGMWVRVLQIPYRLLYPAIIVLVCLGVFSINRSLFDVWMVLGFGILGYGMRLLEFEPAPLIIGFILGPMIEQNLRRALLLAGGDPLVILQRPIAGALLALTAGIIVWMIGSWLFRLAWRPGRANVRAGAEGE